jgi:hypothetical protein
MARDDQAAQNHPCQPLELFARGSSNAHRPQPTPSVTVTDTGAKPQGTANPPDKVLNDFSELVTRLLQIAVNHPAQHFVAAITDDDLNKLGKFVGDLAMATVLKRAEQREAA